MKTNLTSIFKILLIVCTTQVCLAQKYTNYHHKPQLLIFKKAKDLPLGLIYSSYTTDGRYVYCINGITPYNNTYPWSTLLKYDVQADQWTVLTGKLVPKIQAVAAYVPGTGKIYIMGGTVLGLHRKDIFNNVESVDVQTGEVKRLDIANPLTTTYGGISVWKNEIYIFGGSRLNGLGISSLYKFDPVAETFTQLTDMPEYVQAAGAIVNGKLYVFGGYNPSQHYNSNQINVYDLETNQWKTEGKLPETLSANAVAVSGNRIYIVGNYSDLGFIGYYNTETHKFIQLKSNMEPRRHAGAVVVDGKLVVFGGNTNSAGMALSSTQVADVSKR